MAFETINDTSTKQKFDNIPRVTPDSKFPDRCYWLTKSGSLLGYLSASKPFADHEICMVSKGGDTERWYIHYNKKSAVVVSQREIQALFKKLIPGKLTVDFLGKTRFKIDGNRRYLVVNNSRQFYGAMNESFQNWRGPYDGRTWQKQLGEDFQEYLKTQFDLTWAHKAVCQHRGEYQFLPNVALFFDSVDDLVLKLINRPNDKDTCEGFYVGTLFGRPFGYHIDGNQPRISEIDDYMRHSIEDILQTTLNEADLNTRLFATDVTWDPMDQRWILNSTIGEIGHLVKGIVPDNTCDIRKHVKWTLRINGWSPAQIPFLEPLLVDAFHRGYQRLCSHTSV